MEQEDLFSSSSKKFRKNNHNEDESVDMINMDYDSGIKGQKNQLRKYIEDFARLEDIEQKLDELQDSLSSLDPNVLIDLTSKLNIGKEIQMEVAEMMQNIEDNNQYSAYFQISFAEFKRAQEMLDQMQQYKLNMVSESQQLTFLIQIKEFLEKLMKALKMTVNVGRKGGKETDKEIKQFDENLKFIQAGILSDDSLGEKLELDQLNGLYVDLLSAIDLAQKLPEKSRNSKIKLVKFLEDKFTEAIWINKATDLKNSDTTSVIQMSFSKFNDLLRQVPKENQKAQQLLKELDAMKEKYLAYANLFKDLETIIDEKKISFLPSDQLKTLSTKLQQASSKYKEVPYALKLDLKQKQQFVERIQDSINWSINAKGILEERVQNVEKLEQILIEQTQKQLQPSQKLLIKDINERISAVKKCDSQLNQIKEQIEQYNQSKQQEQKNKYQVQVFIELFDTYKDLNQYIELESQLNQVEDFLKKYQDEEFTILKLTKNWMSSLNEQNLELKSFKSDLENVSSLIKKSIFEWNKYEANIQGLELAIQIKEIIQTSQEESMNEKSDMIDEDKKLSWKSVLRLKEQLAALEQKDNYVIKNFDGRNVFLKSIEDYQLAKQDLDNIGKKSITQERFDEICSIIQNTFIHSPNDQQRLMKIKQLKEKIYNEMREFEVCYVKKEKVDIKRIFDVLESIKLSGLKLDDKKVQLEKKIHIANQIIRIVKTSANFDVDKIIEQYNNQSVQIEQMEEMITENKQVNNDLEDFQEKIIYSFDDYEDLMEIYQKIGSVKLHFTRKRPYLLLKQKIFSLLTILIWKSWSENKPLFGFNYNSLKSILNDSELYDEFIILNKAKIKQLNIFTQEKQQKAQMPKIQRNSQKENEMQIEDLPSTETKVKKIEELSAQEIVMDLEKDKEDIEKDNKDDNEEKIYLGDEENNNITDEPKNARQQECGGAEEQIMQQELNQQEEIEEELISQEKKLKSIQEIIVDERVQVEISILKECRDLIKSMWDQVMKRVRYIREAQKSAEIEKLENEYAYQLGCVDLMDILIEQKILVQGKEELYEQEQLKKKKLEEQQNQMKEQQYQAAQYFAQTQLQIQQQKNNNKTMKKSQNVNQSTNVVQSQTNQQVPNSSDSAVEKILATQSFAQFDQKKIKIAKKIIGSMISNPHYKDLNHRIIENTVSYLIKKIVQFQYTQDYIEQIFEFFNELKEDVYLAEQYRKESFSFKSFSTMMRLQSNKLQDNIKIKKRKLNEDQQQVSQQGQELEIQLEKQQKGISLDDVYCNTVKKAPSKIIDHDEYVKLNYRFSNTQIKDPLFKEFYRLLQSKETLAQFRKYQQELQRIAGEADFQAGQYNGNETEEEDEEEENKKKSIKSSKNKSSLSSIGSKSKLAGQFSSEDEEDYQQEIIQSHPSVLKYIKDDRVKKLIDPIKEEEMDSFIDFCNNQLRQKLTKELGQIRIMYNPLTNDEEYIKHQKGSKNDASGYETDDGDEKNKYDPEQIKNQKNIYSIYQGQIHLRPDTNQVPLEVTCIIESTEALLKECPVFKYGDMIKQSGESEMLETKEFLIRSYKCETILSLFGSIESDNEEAQKQLDSLAQDLKNRDRVSIALWNTATKMYIFHKKLFERDHCGNRIQKKLNLSSSELCFAIIFKSTSCKPEEIESITKITDPVLYAQSPSDFLELQAIKTAQKRENEEFRDMNKENLFDSSEKPKFKKPLPKYKKDTVLKIYLPLKESESNIKENQSKNTLSLLVKPRTKEIEKKIEYAVQKHQFQSNFVRQQPPLRVTQTPEYNPQIDEILRRRVQGKRTGKKSIMLDDLKLKVKDPNNQKPNLLEQSQFNEILPTTNKKFSMSKKSVTISDKIQEEEDLQQQQYNDDLGYNDNDYGGINDYQENQFQEVTPFEVNPVRKTELSSVSSLHYNKSVSSKQSKSILSNKMSSVSSLSSQYKDNFNRKPKSYIEEDYLTQVNTYQNSRQPKQSVMALMGQDSNSEQEEEQENQDYLQKKVIEQANRNMQLLSEDSQTPIYSKSSISSLSEESMAKNNQKLQELASILDQMKTNTAQNERKASTSSISVSQFEGSLNGDSNFSKVSSIKSRRPYSTVSKNTLKSVSYNDESNQQFQEDFQLDSQEMDQEEPQYYHQNNQYQNKFNFNNRNKIANNYLEPEESDYKPSDISSLPSSDQSNSRFAQPKFTSQGKFPQTKLQFQKNSNYDNKENTFYNNQRDLENDGILTPQLSLSKDSYSKLSVPSLSSYSGKRSHNTFNSNQNQPAFNKSSKFSISSYHSNRTQQYSEDLDYEKQTPVLENFVNNTFRNDNTAQNFNSSRNFNNNNNNPTNYQRHQQNNSYQTNNQSQRRPLNTQPQAYIYEQDSYQYNSKVFNKSMQKSIHKNQSAFNIQNYYNEDDQQQSEPSSINSKIYEEQILDFRDQLDSLLQTIKHKKFMHQQ
ncbi:hypothetical protein TTHERM_00985110 (macronuclear) [Tetrahymena thermophila SB210]|uniref:Uncharacterized protein n=1 Tax=Tetrahymena thermophila (strain SB210) TaxID=312017 RepID=Q233W7_TETTS|nr:hypothetical protein TTHERM_00985110 [Tetrahymena thermophila SB210]EAR91817.2 hypothetical protein TTHERM_00985110 [Tetrahymena thermophila SB210]|eukprot:XP_001012062.2 hypothetical protein TTHERM_00985110 [Tetrahymena thermophila SB210]